MKLKVIKRNGELVDFESHKIVDAICKAGCSTGEFDREVSSMLTNRIVDEVHSKPDEIVTIESIQDIVEDILLNSKYKRTAKAYVLYRAQHAQMRNIAETSHIDLMDNYLDKFDWQVKENSNMAYSLQGLNNYVASEVTKTYWLEKIYPPSVREAHLNGDIHLHDLNLLSVYCVGWDLVDLLTQGFKGVPGKTSSAPAKHFRSALGQIVNFYYTLQGEAAGAQAFSSFDTLLAPFIREDNLSYKEVQQALQEFVFNVNVPTRVGFQTPFTNITLDLTPPEHFSKMPIIIGGHAHENLTYGDFQREMDMLNKAFLEVMTQGDAQGRVFTFPIPTYNITEDFDWENPVVETLWEAAAKYGIPYFSNFINSDMKPEDSRSMCCRLRIDNRELAYRGGGLFGANPLTGSIGVATLNMPRIGLTSSGNDEYFAKVRELMDICKESLEIKRKYLEKLTQSNLYPYTKFYLRDVKSAQGTYWCNHFSTIGLIGMNESLENFLGEDIASKRGKEFAEKVLEFMRDILVEYQEETGHNYNLEATPAEGTCYRLALMDQKLFDDAIFANGQGKEVKTPFYTNSSHLPVNYTDDLFELLELQDELQTKYTGGTVIHFFLGERASDPQALKHMVRKICEQYRLPYFTFTPSFSVCSNHGYLSGEQHFCPKCNEPAEVYSRVVGYLRSVSQWNEGKRAEFDMREHYSVEASSQKVLI